MATRQFKVEVQYGDTQVAELYWNDNATVEYMTLPVVQDHHILITRLELLEALINFCKTSDVQVLEVTRL